jgi:hypothetical protein
MGKNQDPGSGINIPDPQHCKEVKVILNQKMVTKLTEIWAGSGIRKLPHPGIKNAPYLGSGYSTLY